MNRREAKKIAENITSKELQDMLNLARDKIIDWTEVSSVNKSMSKGAVWNVLTKEFDVKKEYSFLVITNMVWEFGEFLSDALKPPKRRAKERPTLFHQAPVFCDTENNKGEIHE